MPITYHRTRLWNPAGWALNLNLSYPEEQTFLRSGSRLQLKRHLFRSGSQKVPVPIHPSIFFACTGGSNLIWDHVKQRKRTKVPAPAQNMHVGSPKKPLNSCQGVFDWLKDQINTIWVSIAHKSTISSCYSGFLRACPRGSLVTHMDEFLIGWAHACKTVSAWISEDE